MMNAVIKRHLNRHLFVVRFEKTVVNPPYLPPGVLFGHVLHGDERILQTLAANLGIAIVDRQLQVLLELFQTDALQHAFCKVQIEAKMQHIRKSINNLRYLYTKYYIISNV